jgi:hypothetical protein
MRGIIDSLVLLLQRNDATRQTTFNAVGAGHCWALCAVANGRDPGRGRNWNVTAKCALAASRQWLAGEFFGRRPINPDIGA